MRSRAEIEARIQQIWADERYHYPTATVFVNAPLALLQTALEEQMKILCWVLEEPVRAPARKEPECTHPPRRERK
jgi:hypothetical protein